MHSLLTNRLHNPLGLGDSTPELSWSVDADDPAGFELQASATPSFDGALLWTGRSEGTVVERHARFGGVLQSRQRVWWRVRSVDDEGSLGEWSDTAWFEMGLLEPRDWNAQWITGGDPQVPETLYFSGTINVPTDVVKARAYATALGWYRLIVNGVDVTGPALVPRWTPFDSCVEYQVYDITEALQEGAVRVGMVVSEGRFRGKLGGLSLANRYGDRLAAIAQIELETADGDVVRFRTDETWSVGRGRIKNSDPKHGEHVDLRLPDTWDTIRERADHAPVELLPMHPRTLIAEEVARVTRTGTRRGTVSRTPSGSTLIDFGQNFSGVAAVRLGGREGAEVSLAYGEVLTPEGELDTTYLGNKEGTPWFQTDSAILGAEPEWWTPAFTIHGFRYLVVSGDHEPLTEADVEGIVMTTDLSETGMFTSSDERLNKLHENIRWSMRSNFTDTPSDCPTRERSGWTGDVQTFAATAMILADTNRYLRRYLRNLAIEQFDDGRVPVVIPSESSQHSRGIVEKLFALQSSSVGWGDAAVIVPWEVYWRYGDERALEEAYPAARAWVEQLARRAARKRHVSRWTRAGRRDERYIVDTGFHFGEWLRPGEDLGSALVGNLLRPPAVVATAYLVHSATLLTRMARVLGHDDDERRYSALSTNARRAWNRAFVSDGGSRIGADKQDDYVRALGFDLLPKTNRPAALTRLEELITEADGHLGTGFLSTPMLLRVLSRNGRADLARKILMQPTAPSWIAQIERGATTTWETWEGYKRDGHAYRSHNHYSFGSVAQWLHEDLAGLRPAAPGYSKIVIEPTPIDGVDHASTSVATPHGTAACSWSRTAEGINVTITVPPGAVAEVRLPHSVFSYGPGIHTITPHRVRTS
ncbi:family 78 glycoside hydrolase catalytic domain [Microbacterium sp. NPDC058345]|uniref:alpha-L-rhamnosidase n=1 Tax=Microbacterium sp. NPDC058345 TaxID=3346455 RepID=UPI0036592277